MRIDFRKMNRSDRKMVSKAMAEENKAFGDQLVPIHLPHPHESPKNRPFAVYRSRGFLVQLYEAPGGAKRISVNRTMINVETGEWLDGISWEMLQKIKREVGFGDFCAVEVYPRDSDVVNVANIRHLFVLSPENTLPFVWRKNDP